MPRPIPGERMPPQDRHPPAYGVVRVGPMMSVPEVLGALGCDPKPVISSVGLNPAQFEDPDITIPYLAASRLLARCVEASGCQHFGLLLGERANPSALGVAGFMLRSAPDVGTALRGLVKFFNLHDQGGVPTLTVTGNVTVVGYAVYQTGAEATDQIYDLSMALGCNIMRALCGPGWNPTEVLLSRRPPQDLTPYRRFFRAPLRFGAHESALVFRTGWLDHALPSADPWLNRHLEREAEALQKGLSEGLVGELRRLLRRCIATHQCSATDLAAQMGMHERTLHRRLQDEGTSFRREIEAMRYAVSQSLLSETVASPTEIANSLGYADASAFSRAFKRWSGITPAQWRVRNEGVPSVDREPRISPQ